jgi:DNA-binding MarR family transcriptional regulator
VNTHPVEQVWSFNRTVAEAIGPLGARILGRARPSGESRLLWEIGPEGSELRELRARLHLDSGYLSRLLAALEEQGLVTVRSLPEDRRVRRAELTEAGKKERADLDRRSAAIAARVLDPLSESQRARLLAAMAEVERLLQASLAPITAEEPVASGSGQRERS